MQALRHSVVLAVAALCLMAAGCSASGNAPGPFALWVVFQPRTTNSQAAAVVHRCASSRQVVSVAAPRVRRGAVLVVIKTRDAYRNKRTQPLLHCLEANPHVKYAAWPA